MENLLPITWFIESPIDFEHKQYVLLGYLQKVEISFLDKKLSPHLLHLEKLTDELLGFESSFQIIKKDFDKNRYVYFDNVKLEGEDDQTIIELIEIVKFSIPQIQPRLKMGYKILEKNRQILY
jgi:hypothetical protein